MDGSEREGVERRRLASPTSLAPAERKGKADRSLSLSFSLPLYFSLCYPLQIWNATTSIPSTSATSSTKSVPFFPFFPAPPGIALFCSPRLSVAQADSTISLLRLVRPP